MQNETNTTKITVKDINSSLTRLKTYYSDNAAHNKALQINAKVVNLLNETDGVKGFKPAQLLAAISAYSIASKELTPNVNAPGVMETHISNLSLYARQLADDLGISYADAEASFIELGSDSEKVAEMAVGMVNTPENVEGFAFDKMSSSVDVLNESTKTLTEDVKEVTKSAEVFVETAKVAEAIIVPEVNEDANVQKDTTVADTLVDIANKENVNTIEEPAKSEIVTESKEASGNFKTIKLENYKIAKGKKGELKAYLASQDMEYVLEDIEAGEPLEFEVEIIEELKKFLTF